MISKIFSNYFSFTVFKHIIETYNKEIRRATSGRPAN